ncbi:MAG: DUF4857 domain-containing protein [Bacteroidales bacterium]
MKNLVQYIIIIISTLLLLWVLPQLLKMTTYERTSYDFAYFSSLLEDFIETKVDGKEIKQFDLKGNEYSEKQYDSIVPLLNYRQLLKDNALPDSLFGMEINGKILQAHHLYFRYSPKTKNNRGIALYPMFESMSGRVNLSAPDDMFTLKNKISFIDAETNKVNEAKSRMFQERLEKLDFQFPAQWLAGNPSERKPYDEGWFALDSKDDLYHIKMVNGKPFIKNTKLPDGIKVEYMSTIETANHRFYGFIFTKDGEVYYLEDITYKPVKIPIDKMNIDKEQLTILGNIMYWTVYLTSDTERKHYALRNDNLEPVAKYTQTRENIVWDRIKLWAFPSILTLESSNSTFIYPRFSQLSMLALALGFICVLVFIALYRKNSTKSVILHSLFILITGVCGLLAVLLFTRRDRTRKNIIHLK